MGCKVGAGKVGEDFLQHLANCLGAEVCAYNKVMYSRSSWLFGIFPAKLGKDKSAKLICKGPAKQGVPFFPNWYTGVMAVAVAGGSGYFVWRRRLAHEQT